MRQNSSQWTKACEAIFLHGPTLVFKEKAIDSFGVSEEKTLISASAEPHCGKGGGGGRERGRITGF